MDLLPDVWRQDYWLPPGVTWRDMEQLADSDRPQPLDLLVALPLALGFVALRCVFERCITHELSLFCEDVGDAFGILYALQDESLSFLCKGTRDNEKL